MSNKIKFPENYPDSYQNDYIEATLMEWTSEAKVWNEFLEYLYDNQLKIGYPIKYEDNIGSNEVI